MQRMCKSVNRGKAFALGVEIMKKIEQKSFTKTEFNFVLDDSEFNFKIKREQD